MEMMSTRSKFEPKTGEGPGKKPRTWRDLILCDQCWVYSLKRGWVSGSVMGTKEEKEQMAKMALRGARPKELSVKAPFGHVLIDSLIQVRIHDKEAQKTQRRHGE